MNPLADLEAQLHNDGRALRGLARDLVGDVHAADDLLQEAVRRTLQHPPREPGGLGGWLRTVVQRLSLQHRRGERNRQLRERAAARPERLEATVDIAARREALRAVTAAVFALDEPYQTTLLLRYFEDRTPAAIAAATGTNLATVKSRLQRGLQLLRARLDADQSRRDWRRALVAAVGLPALTTATLMTGAMLMSQGTKIAVGVVAAAACAAVVWSFTDSSVPTITESTPQQPSPQPTPIADADDHRTTAPGERTAVADAIEGAEVLAHPYAFDLQIEVRDRDGLPVADASVSLGPLGCSLARVPGSTGPDGVLHAQWHGKRPEMEMAVLVESMPTMRRVIAHSGAVQRVVIGGPMNRGGNITFTFANNGGGNGSAAFQVVTAQPDQLSTNGAQHEYLNVLSTFIGRSSSGQFDLRSGLHPFAVFGDALAAVPRTEEKGVQVANQEISFSLGALLSDAVVTNGNAIAVLDSKQKGAEPPPTILEGIVLDEDGKPVPRAVVSWGDMVDIPQKRMRTDDQGRFRFAKITAGPHEVRAGGGDGGIARLRIDVAAEKTTRWEARLVRESTIRGRALDAQGKPLAKWVVEAMNAQGTWFDACTVHDDGTFVLPNQPGGLATLLLRSNDDNVKLPVAIAGSVLPDSNELIVRFDAATAAGKLQIEPVLPEGVQDVQAEVRVWQEETGRGTAMHKDDKLPIYSLGGLPAGWYRVEVGASQLGWSSAGRQWIDGKALLDLGKFALPVPGKLHIARAPGSVPTDDKLEQEICVRRPDCDVRVEDAQAAKGTDLVLPAGDYWLLWRDLHGARQLRPFTIRAGQLTALDVDATADAGATKAR